jgi:hypothetical protein
MGLRHCILLAVAALKATTQPSTTLDRLEAVERWMDWEQDIQKPTIRTPDQLRRIDLVELALGASDYWYQEELNRRLAQWGRSPVRFSWCVNPEP